MNHISKVLNYFIFFYFLFFFFVGIGKRMSRGAKIDRGQVRKSFQNDTSVSRSQCCYYNSTTSSGICESFDTGIDHQAYPRNKSYRQIESRVLILVRIFSNSCKMTIFMLSSQDTNLWHHTLQKNCYGEELDATTQVFFHTVGDINALCTVHQSQCDSSRLKIWIDASSETQIKGSSSDLANSGKTCGIFDLSLHLNWAMPTSLHASIV